MRSVFAIFLLASQLYASPVPYDHDLKAAKGPFTDKLIALLNQWPIPELSNIQVAEDEIKFRCIKTGDANKSVGMEQTMVIKSPIAKIAKIVDDIDHYKHIFLGFKEIKVTHRNENVLTTYWEQHIPVFANTRYELFYILDKKNPERYVYRYQLKNSNRVTSSDGIIVLEKQGPDQTRYTEIDFFEADTGIVKMISEDRFWKESVEGMFVSDAALKIEAENPGLSLKAIKEKAQDQFSGYRMPDRRACMDFYKLKTNR